jgi:hypothetical protein
MKRNMNLIHLLLLETESEEPRPDLSQYSEGHRVYHSALLIEAGLVHGGGNEKEKSLCQSFAVMGRSR